MPARYAETAKLTTEAEIHLYELDLRPVGVIQSIYFCNYAKSGGAPISFAGRQYLPLPMEGSSFGLTISNSESTPKVAIADVGKLVSAIVAQAGGELGGAVLKRTKVYRQNLDDGSDPDSTAAFPAEKYTVDTQQFDGVVYTFALGSLMNFTSVRIPRIRIRKLLDDNNA